MSGTPTPQSRFIDLGSLRMHYLDWGGDSQRTLLLAHGQGGNAHNWDHIAGELHNEFRVIAIDQRGHGDSDHTREGYAVTAFALDLDRFADALGIAPYSYCGASLGARNGIAYAGDRSDQLKHFVCLDYGPEMSVKSARNQIGGANRRPLGWRSQDDYIAYASEQNPRAPEAYLQNQATYALRLNYADKYVLKHDPEMFWINGSFGVREVPYLWEQWANISCPILELKGTESDYLSPESLRRMLESQPAMKLVEVPESGHSVAADNPEFLIRELKRFLVD